MNTNLIATFKMKTHFSDAIKWQRFFYCGLISFFVFVLTLFPALYFGGVEEPPLYLPILFSSISFLAVTTLISNLDIGSCEAATLSFYPDKLIIKEHYEIKKTNSAFENFVIEQMVKNAKPINRVSEYSYTEITHFDLFYHFTKQKQNEVEMLSTNNFSLTLTTRNKKEKLDLLVGDMSVVMQMQAVLKKLYALNLNISEGTSEHKKTYLLYYKNDSDRKMLDLINEIGKNPPKGENPA